MHVAGLRRPQLVEAGEPIGFRDLVRRGGPITPPAAPSRVAVAPQKRSARSVGDVDRSKPSAGPTRPAWSSPPARRAAVPARGGCRRRRMPRRPRCGSCRSKLGQLAVERRRHRPSALLHVGDPVRAMPRHRGDRLSLDHEDAEIVILRAGAADEALQIVDIARPASGGGRSPRLATSTSPRPCEPKSGFSTSGPAPRFRRRLSARPRSLPPPSRRNRQPGLLRAGRSSSTCRRSARSRSPRSRPATPSAFKACRMPSRRVTASKLPAATVRTMRAIRQARQASRAASPTCDVLSNAHRSSGMHGVDAPRCRTRARSSRACQSRAAAKSTIRAAARLGAARSPSGERSIEEVGRRQRRRETSRRSRAPSPATAAGLNSIGSMA